MRCPPANQFDVPVFGNPGLVEGGVVPASPLLVFPSSHCVSISCRWAHGSVFPKRPVGQPLGLPQDYSCFSPNGQWANPWASTTVTVTWLLARPALQPKSLPRQCARHCLPVDHQQWFSTLLHVVRNVLCGMFARHRAADGGSRHTFPTVLLQAQGPSMLSPE